MSLSEKRIHFRRIFAQAPDRRDFRQDLLAPSLTSSGNDPILFVGPDQAADAFWLGGLGHVPEKWLRLSDKDMLQVIELARILIDQAIPRDRDMRWCCQSHAQSAKWC